MAPFELRSTRRAVWFGGLELVRDRKKMEDVMWPDRRGSRSGRVGLVGQVGLDGPKGWTIYRSSPGEDAG